MSQKSSKHQRNPHALTPRPGGVSALQAAAFRAAATIGAGDAMFPKVSQSSLEFPFSGNCGTNPLSPAVAAPFKSLSATHPPTLRNEPNLMSPKASAASPLMFPKVSQSSLKFPQVPSCETKPIAPEPVLTDRQRAAARLLAAGKRVTDVAAEVGLTRQSITRWKRQENFCALIDREHAQQTRAVGEAAGRRASPGSRGKPVG